ncbi:MAG: hypothetical protein ACK5KN_02585 [Dysgonomonas sp.]|jgi:hypothetical protein|uniref:hypothetical protein n=1 Tax=Dysgonomonas sp. TaxID=1891233 RepID=UPI0028199CD4|nr:hypothetical protein [Prevotella sp.]MDR2002332.1 hypothetical protein [Prevotella sp.]
MKKITKIGALALSILLTVLLWRCTDADEDHVHNTNTISQMICKAQHGASEFRGEIMEYDKNGNLVSGDFTQEEVEGGYGLVLFAISKSLENDVDLTNIYLTATVTYDEFITPSLSGRHDITGEGIIITVKSGIGTTRQYRVRGYYE